MQLRKQSGSPAMIQRYFESVEKQIKRKKIAFSTSL